MKKELRIEKPGHDLDQLTDELFEAFPGWRRPSGMGGFETDVRVSAEGDAVLLVVPEEADETAVRGVVDAHTPRERTQQPTAGDVITALASMNLDRVTTVAGLKAEIEPIRAAAAAVVEGQG